MNTETAHKNRINQSANSTVLSAALLFTKTTAICFFIGCTIGLSKAVTSLVLNDHIGRKMARAGLQAVFIEYRTGAILGLSAGCLLGASTVVLWLFGGQKKRAVTIGIISFLVALVVIVSSVKNTFMALFPKLFPMDYVNPGISPDTVFRALLVPSSIDWITFQSIWAETLLFFGLLLGPALITGIVSVLVYRLAAKSGTSGKETITVLDRKWYIPIVIFVVIFAFLQGTNRADPQTGTQPDVILISIDTLRADHVGCYGYKKPTTPNLDALSKIGIRYQRAISPAPWTLPTHLSVFTGQYPMSHGVTDFDHKLDKKQLMPAELFKENGFATGGFTGHFLLSPVYGFKQGFDRYIMDPEANAMRTVGRSLDWVQKARGRRIFLFVHLFDPHWPYDWHQGVTEKFAGKKKSYKDDHTFFYDFVSDVKNASAEKTNYWLGRYDGEISYTDRELGRLLEALKNEKRFDNAWIVVFSDHGEAFGDHGFFGHAISCYQETIRVPLIVKPPKGVLFDPVIEQPVSLTNIAGLLAKVVNFDLTTEKGTGVLPIVNGNLPAIQLSESRIWGGHRYALLRPDMKIWHSPNMWKFGEFSGSRADELFDLAVDPNELEDLTEKMPGLAIQTRKMGNLIYRKYKDAKAPTVNTSDSMRRRLKELGYVE